MRLLLETPGIGHSAEATGRLNAGYLSFLTVFAGVARIDACHAKNEHAREEAMDSIFEPWVGRPVVVQLGLGRIKLSVRGTFLEDRDETLLVRPEAGSDVEIPKMKVLAIEDSCRWTKPMITFL